MFLSAATALGLFSVVVNSLPVRHGGELYFEGAKWESKEVNLANDDHSYYFDQRLDHFDRENEDTFQQRYFYNTTYWKGADSNAPVFLCVGGEGPPLDYLVLVDSVHCNDMVELAWQHGALLLALEHRYYGPSIPNNSLETENMKWLNSEQALGDIAHFHTVMTEKFHLTSANKWVTWGGSYPGMMAALARYRYPHLIHAAVSSSSPLQPQVEMEEYNEVVADSMAAVDVGGSQQCLDIIVNGHKEIGEMLKSRSGQFELETLFNVCVPGSLSNEKNQEQFAGDGVVYLPVQSNDPACTTPLCNIESICSFLTGSQLAEESDVKKLAELSGAMSGGACKVVSYDAMISGISNPKNPQRSWLYQTCTEWGFYQTCPVGSRCPYTQGLHTLQVDYDICQSAFGVSPSSVNRQNKNTFSIFGGNKLQATRVMYPNGQIDPWKALGVLSPPNKEQVTLYVTGASHHYWTHTTLPTDNIFIREARKAIWDQVNEWLME